MSRRDQTAPGRLELVREFVNSRDIEDGIEELGTPAAARAWIAAHDLPGAERTPSGRELELLTEVREALRSLMLANNLDEPPPPAALATLNAVAKDAAVGLRFGDDGSEIVTLAGGVAAALASLLATVHIAIQDGTWRRLKVCPAEDCQWAFYDRSRNRSGTWCEMGVCGNRAKARAFRERRKAETPEKSRQ